MRARLLFVAAVGASLILASCGSKSKLPKGEVELTVPCSEFKSDKKTFRVYSFGESLDQNVAKKKALSNARAELAVRINRCIKEVVFNYVKSK